jgi:hypothetical protein
VMDISEFIARLGVGLNTPPAGASDVDDGPDQKDS